MTSGSFTMMSSSDTDEEERESRRRERDRDLGEANDWDITNGGECEESEEAWVLTDARDNKMGKCVKFAADSKCSPQCFSNGKTVDETEEGAAHVRELQRPRRGQDHVPDQVQGHAGRAQ